MSITNENEFGLSDFSLVVTLETLDFKVDRLDRTSKDRRMKFIFSLSEEEQDSFFDAVARFHKGKLLVCPKLFSFHSKQLKQRLYSDIQ